MKKLMTSTIILLPLIILAILLVSGAIKALMTHIYVDRVEFVDDDTLVLVMDDEENPPAEQLEVNVLPLKAENRDLIFSMDDESIATVDASGNVVAKFYGETYVNVMSAEDTLKKDRRRVLVTDDAVHKIEITEDCPTDMYEANTEQLAAVIYPREAREAGVKWTTSNPEILAISETGIIQAKGYGEATITATSVENAEIFDSVTIQCHSAIDEIKTETGVRRVETALETAQFPNLIQSPLEADVKIAYTSDDPDIAKVDENGQIIFSKAGKVTITATATDFGNTQASTCVEYVSTLHYYRLPLFEKKMYTVDFDEYYDAATGSAIKPLEIPFAAGFEPENTDQEIKNVEFSISSKKVLEFDTEKEAFYFAGEMPDGTSDIRVTVTAEVYDTETDELTEKKDAFTLTVQRKAKSIAVGYNGTENAQSIVLSDRTLIFGTDSGATAPISVFPSNHTDKLSYALENAEGTATLSGGTLTFRKAGSVNVLVSCKYTESGETHAESRITVSYAPATAAEHKAPVTVTPPQEEGQPPAKQQVLLSMENDIKEEGVLYFAEPAGTTVTYAVEDAANAAVELKVVDGVQHIVPKKGGFATITITVSPNSPRSAAAIALFSAPRSGEPEGTTVYTVEIYVDKHVSAEDLSVKLNGKPATGALFGATGTSVSYELAAADTDSAMAGKVLYVTYSGLTAPVFGKEDSATASGNIAFPEDINSLAVTFGVRYSDKAVGLGAKGDLPTVTRTLKRNAESITFRYRETDVSAITTTRNSLTFKTAEAANDTEVYVKIGPDNHTDTPVYSLAGEQDGAKITPQGVLTFTGNTACTVTVQIRLRGLDGEISDTHTIEVNYAPRSEGDTVITLPADNGKKFLLSMTDTAKIDYVVPAGATVDCTSQNKVVSIAEKNGEWTIAPQKGGFDTVTFKVNGAEQSYTIYVYVDRTVANNFTVEMNGDEVSQYYSTKEDAVPFTVTVHCEEGAMEGKQIYVKYGETTLTGEEGEPTFTDTIGFAGLATLPVTFGVQYAESANEYGKTGELGVSASRTIARNATGVTFSYKGTMVSDVTTTSSTLNFKTGKTAVAGEVYVEILPAEHTDTVRYSLTGSNATIDATSGELKFTKADEPCTVTVKIQLVGKDGKDSVSAEIQVHYTPRGKEDKEVNLPDDDKSALDLLLFMNGNGAIKDKGKIVYVVPAGAEIDCTSQNGVVSVAEENGEWTITPQKGGFGTVKYKVTGENLKKEYTINVYVNRAVAADNIDVTLQDTTLAEGVYGTTKTAVPFTVTVNCAEADGAMEGKQIYVKYNGQTKATGAQNSNTFTDTIDFADLSTLEVTFGVEYAENTSAYKPEESDDVALSSVTRTLARNAESITVTYGKVATAKIVTKDAAIDFDGTVTVAPANHTDTTLAYVLEDGAGIATLAGSKLTFRQAGTVTVQVQTKRGETVTLTKSVTVTYEALGANQELRLGAQTETKNIAMSLGKDALIYYTVPENATVTYEVSGGGVINGSYKHGADAASGVYHITPQKGGLATVTVKVNGDSINETHTFNIYVNAPVSSDNITVKFGGEACAQNVSYGTTETAVSFEVTVNCEEGAMVGKQLYVEYKNGQIKRLTAIAGQTTYTDTIEFSGDLGDLTVTFGVEYASDTSKYNSDLTGIAFGATTARTIGRNTQSIAVKYGSVETEKIVTHESVINLQEDVQIVVEPANHTDTFAYGLEGDGNGIASIEGSELKFTGSGTVTVIIKTVRNGTETCSKTITVTYEPLGGNIEIKLDKTDQSIVLPLVTENQKQALIYYTVPKGATAAFAFTIRNKDSDVITTEFKNGADDSFGVYHIVPKTGGFATVTVTVEGGDADAVYTIKVYVDAPVTEDDFTVELKADSALVSKPAFAVYDVGQEFITSYTYMAYRITVANNNGSMLGKQLCIEYTGQAKPELVAERTFKKFPYSVINFGENTTLTFTFSVQYTAEATACGATGQDSLARTSRTAITTKGTLKTAPTVTYNDGEEKTLNTDGTLFFANIGDEIDFTVSKDFTPADYTLNKESIKFEGNGFVEMSTTDGTTFTLKAKKCTETDEQAFTLYIGKQAVTLKITVKAKAQEIQVTCGKTVLGDGQKYKTLLGELTFDIKVRRIDGEPFTAPALQYRVDGASDWQPFENGQYTLNGLVVDGDAKSVEFRTTDGSELHFKLLVERVKLTDFSMEVRVDLGDGNAPIAIGREKSVSDAGGSLQYVLPARMTGTVALYIVADGEYLGGFGTDDQFKEIIPAQWQSVDWTIEHTLISTGKEILPHANINLRLPSEMGNSASVEIGGGDCCGPQCTITFTSGTSLAWIEFPGFDGNNNTDVYKGYQQVRVFAKHSDYDGKNTVDYYRIPVKAYADVQAMKEKNTKKDLTDLTWKLTSYTDDKATTAAVVTQTGRQVIYNGVTYNIVGDAGAVTLQLPSQDGAATTVVNANGAYADGQPHVPWVDTVSEAAEGYIRVYFGEFKGLSESDVQNDLFGNFGEKKGWSKPEGQTDIKGNSVTPSAGAFSFLRLESGDGAVGGVNAHFNFNVLEDPDANAANNLVNVFNATGYYAHTNLVLQENLYGEGELTGEEKLSAEVEEKGLYLKETGNLGKTLLYGNGYQVNLEAFNASIVADMNSHPNNYPNGYNESRAVTFNRAYNAVIKGSNPRDELKGKIQTTNLHMAYAYYCDLSYYYKFNPDGNTFYAKNTVFSCIPKTAVQLYYDDLTMYAENIVMTECGTSIQAENTSQQNIKIYYRGSIDILNYFNQPMLSNMNALVGGFFGEVVPNVINYFEWHGQNIEANASTLSGADRIYVNILAFAASDLNDKVFVWNGNGYGNIGSATLDNGSKIVSKTLVDYFSYHYYAATYEMVDASGERLDKATVNFENNKFTGKADLNHLFEGDRIRLQCQFKDVDEKNYEHIKWHKQEVYRDKSLLEGRKTHAEDLRDSLKNTQWADGSYVDGGGAIHVAAELASLISETVIPSKSAY